MTAADRAAIADAGKVCEYWLSTAVAAADSGRLQSSQEALDWAALASTSAFYIARTAA